MKIGIVQMQSILDPEHNLAVIRKFIDEAKQKDVKALYLPEVFYSMSDGAAATPYLVEEGNEHFQKIQKLAKDNQVFLIGGSCATKVGNDVINRIYNFDPNGELIGTYDKIHLFSCDLSRHGSKQIIDEADVYTAGNQPEVLKVGEFTIGMSLCFDLRFPEMFRDYSMKRGCNVLTIASAFTRPTGKAHWQTLVRARAIENQCYVIAANQWGEHNPKIRTYGHSMIVDPWGDILADAGEGECLITAELSMDSIKEIRSRLKVL